MNENEKEVNEMFKYPRNLPPITPEGPYHEQTNEHQLDCRFCVMGRDGGLAAIGRNIAFAQGVASERAKWEKLKGWLASEIRQSKSAKDMGTLTVYGEGNMDAWRSAELWMAELEKE